LNRCNLESTGRRRAALRTTGLLALALATAWPAAAAPRSVEPFTATGWAALQDGLRQPAVVVFTTTDCAHCPAVIAQLARALHQPPRRPLLTVVMDLAPGEADAQLLGTAHYRAADRLLAFDGQAPALRHAVNPAWRGVTPYVALLVPGQPVRWVTGPPAAADIAAWRADGRR